MSSATKCTLVLGFAMKTMQLFYMTVRQIVHQEDVAKRCIKLNNYTGGGFISAQLVYLANFFTNTYKMDSEIGPHDLLNLK